MKLLTSITLIIFITLFYAFNVEAKTVNIVDKGAIAGDNVSDTAAISAAFADVLANGGGTILVPDGDFIHDGNMISVVTPNTPVDIRFVGDGGSRIHIKNGASIVSFAFGNLSSLLIDGITFIGSNVTKADDPLFVDALTVISVDWVERATIKNSNFFALAVTDGRGIIETRRTDLHIDNISMNGCYASYPNGAAILARDWVGLTVENSNFLDYAHYNGLYYYKSGNLVGNWINMYNPKYGQMQVVIRKSRFDEGAARAISIDGADSVQIEGITVNVMYETVGAGVYLSNVKKGTVKDSWFGWSTTSRPAVVANNNSNIVIDGLTFDAAVDHIRKDATSVFRVTDGRTYNIVSPTPAPTPTPTVTPTPTTQTNVALSSNGGVASASSTTGPEVYPGTDFSSSSVNNGDRKGLNWEHGGGWRDGNTTVPDWLQIDFNGSKTITEIDVFTIQDDIYNPVEPTANTTFSMWGITGFDVQYWNGSSWVTVPNGSIINSDKVWNKFVFPAVTTSKIRVLINNSLAGYSRVAEVEAW